MRTGDSPAGWTSLGPLCTACLGHSDLAIERHFTAHYLWVCRGPLCRGNALTRLERSLRGRIFCKLPATLPGRRSRLPLCLALPGRRHRAPPSTPGGTLGLLPPTLPCLLPGVHAKTCLLRGHDRSLSSSTRQAWQRSLPPTLRALSRVGEDLALQCFSRTRGSSARCPLRPGAGEAPAPSETLAGEPRPPHPHGGHLRNVPRDGTVPWQAHDGASCQMLSQQQGPFCRKEEK